MTDKLFYSIIGVIIAGMVFVLVLAGFHPAFAGGYVAPVIHTSTTVEPEKKSYSWTGVYLGGSIGKTSADLKRTIEETKETFKKVWADGTRKEIDKAEYDSLIQYRKDNPHDIGGWGLEHISEAVGTAQQIIDDTDTTYGVFVGYRHQFQNNLVAGAEASYTRTGKMFVEDARIETKAVEAQLGYAMGRFLPYAAVGYAQVEGEDATSLGIGADFLVTENVFVGIKYTKYDIGEVTGIDSIRGWEADTDLVSIRAGWKF